MKFIAVLVGAVALIGKVQAATATTAVAPAAASEAPFVQCLAACDPADNDCRAHCVAVPSPNMQQVNATIECVADCDQGSGTSADIQKYINCRDGCIASNYFTTDGTPAATGSSGAKASTTGADAKATGTSGSDGDSDGDSATNTDSSSGPTDSPDAASSLVMSSSLGFFAVLAAVFAL
jgi:hypothetical protein